MNNKAIYFIGGFIWALVSSRKAYAPNINSNVTKGNQTNPQVSANPRDFDKMYLQYFKKFENYQKTV
tara:strand:+ start:23 stop:223 length:201 start_codon:yes stop_codon:yes gene_type:complete